MSLFTNFFVIEGKYRSKPEISCLKTYDIQTGIFSYSRNCIGFLQIILPVLPVTSVDNVPCLKVVTRNLITTYHDYVPASTDVHTVLIFDIIVEILPL